MLRRGVRDGDADGGVGAALADEDQKEAPGKQLSDTRTGSWRQEPGGISVSASEGGE